ncbi:DoxX family protein [Candidatus Gracilibacteria bacterium]|nr:DoxX family protein [Candidatus Gracilibacteria bacterium]
MSKCAKKALFLLRVSLGLMLLFHGWNKITNPEFTVAIVLDNATNLQSLAGWLTAEGNVVWVSFLAAWGQFLVGIALTFGIFTTLAAWASALMFAMLYLFFPPIDPKALFFIVDFHFLLVVAMGVIAETKAGLLWGADKQIGKKYKLKGCWF